jgi:SAM-dependent methyltransferase
MTAGPVNTMEQPSPYTPQWYQASRERARRSAEKIIPHVLKLVEPASVVDVGCGIGAWLSVFRDLGIQDYLGLDGDWVDRKCLLIPEERFMAVDLKAQLRLTRRFDLVTSMEVAEHLPGDCAELFVESLVRLGSVILFSAAIPFQGGNQHINEQWPEYWVELFRRHGCQVLDCIRSKTWQNEDVDWWYSQNTFMFAETSFLAAHPRLREASSDKSQLPLSLVHPRKYLEEVEETRRLLKSLRDIMGIVRPTDSYILVDHDVLRQELALGDWAIPFLEQQGRYWGPPPDDETAIQELERLRKKGPAYIVFAWPAFWSLSHYTKFHDYLRSKFKCTLENERLVVFDLR